MDATARFEIDLDSALIATRSDEELSQFVLTTLASGMLEAVRITRDAMDRVPAVEGMSQAARSRRDGATFLLASQSEPPGPGPSPSPRGSGSAPQTDRPTTVKLGLSSPMGKNTTVNLNTTLSIPSGSGPRVDEVEILIKFTPK